MTDLFTVWSPASVLSAGVGGFVLGWLLLARLGDNARYTVNQTVVLTTTFGIFAGVVFWSGQVVDTYAQDGPALAWRVVSRALLFVLFIIAIAIGTGLGLRRLRG